MLFLLKFSKDKSDKCEVVENNILINFCTLFYFIHVIVVIL